MSLNEQLIDEMENILVDPEAIKRLIRKLPKDLKIYKEIFTDWHQYIDIEISNEVRQLLDDIGYGNFLDYTNAMDNIKIGDTILIKIDTERQYLGNYIIFCKVINIVGIRGDMEYLLEGLQQSEYPDMSKYKFLLPKYINTDSLGYFMRGWVLVDCLDFDDDEDSITISRKLT